MSNLSVVRFTRSILSVVYLILIILSIPMAFDVGGIECGLSFSLTIFLLYFGLTTLRLLTRKTVYFKWFSIFYYLQYLTIPSILTLFLSYYSGKVKPQFTGVDIWKIFIINSTPIFTIAEGFCSLLSIQAIGQTISWMTKHKSDSWLMVSLIASGSTITAGLYFLYRIYVLPITIDIIGASLLGSLLTLTLGLGLFGIISGKGSIIESSLLFAYIVRCIYETFPQLSENASQAINNIFNNTKLPLDIPILSPQISNTLSTILPFLAANLPGSIKTMFDFLNMSVRKLPLPVLFNFSYRITVFFAGTKIIPALYHSTLYPSSSPPRTPPLIRSRETSTTSISSISLSRSDSNHSNMSSHSNTSSHSNNSNSSTHSRTKSKSSDMLKQFSSGKPPSTIVTLIYSYSPCIIIPVYTHLLMSYNGQLADHLRVWGIFSSDSQALDIAIHPLKFWNWVNMATTLLLYLLELLGNDNHHLGGNTPLTNHWKID